MKTANATMVIMVLLGVVCLCTGTADAIVVDLDQIEVGTIVAGELPDGTILGRNHFEDFSITVDNHGAGPNSLVICEATEFLEHDKGPGGSEHIMMVAGNVIDRRPEDGLVDDPAFEPDGGVVDLHFHTPVNLAYVLLDRVEAHDNHSKLFVDGVEAFSVSNGEQWENTGIFIDLDGYLSVNSIRLELYGGIGIARIAYFPESVDAETFTWGAVKELYK